MKDLVVFGNENFAKLLKYYIETDDTHSRRVVAFTVSKDYIKENTFCDLPVVPFEVLNDFYPPSEYDILLAIGDRKMNSIRKNIFKQCKEKGYTIASFIHSSCKLSSNNIGEGNIFLDDCHLGPFSRIGKGNLLWDNVVVAHDSIVGDFNTFSGHADMCGHVTIGNNCYFGKHALINDYIQIADYTYVGAKAYVKTPTKEYDVIAAPESITIKRLKSTAFVQVLEAMDTIKR